MTIIFSSREPTEEGSDRGNVSVVICIRERAQALDQTLIELQQQHMSEAIEVIVVNNGGTDKTESVLAKSRPSFRMISLYEATPGKSRELNTALTHLHGELDIAVETIVTLRSLGIDAILQVVGPNVEYALSCPHVRWCGTLNKFVSSEFMSLNQLYLESFVMVLPSRAECAGIVLCEAAAFGVPAVGPQIGGMPEIVVNGQTGYVLASETAPTAYASTIARLWRDPVTYRKLCENARTRYEEVLNWNQTVNHLRQLLN
jgi:glycosyltransferase involved in cell wall biosynthesis